MDTIKTAHLKRLASSYLNCLNVCLSNGHLRQYKQKDIILMDYRVKQNNGYEVLTDLSFKTGVDAKLVHVLKYTADNGITERTVWIDDYKTI